MRLRSPRRESVGRIVRAGVDDPDSNAVAGETGMEDPRGLSGAFVAASILRTKKIRAALPERRPMFFSVQLSVPGVPGDT